MRVDEGVLGYTFPGECQDKAPWGMLPYAWRPPAVADALGSGSTPAGWASSSRLPICRASARGNQGRKRSLRSQLCSWCPCRSASLHTDFPDLLCSYFYLLPCMISPTSLTYFTLTCNHAFYVDLHRQTISTNYIHTVWRHVTTYYKTMFRQPILICDPVLPCPYMFPYLLMPLI